MATIYSVKCDESTDCCHWFGNVKRTGELVDWVKPAQTDPVMIVR